MAEITDMIDSTDITKMIMTKEFIQQIYQELNIQQRDI